MSNRTVIVIVAVAAALFAFIALYDRGRMTTGELEGRKDRVFADLRTDLVEAIEIRGSSGEKIALVREARRDGADADPGWRITSPRELPADGAAVREILSALDFLVKKRVVIGAGERDKPQYGLAKPAVIASFTARGATTAFRIGTGEGAGDTVYVAVDGRGDELYAVEKDFSGSMDKGLDDLRDKHLVPGSLDGAVGLEIARAGEPISAARKGADDPWRISRGGVEMLAAGDQIASLLADVANVRAEEFVADGAGDGALAQYGLDAPSYRITIRPAKGEPTKLLLGKPCPEEGRVYAAVEGSGTVACVPDDIATSAGRPASRFAETRPLAFAEDEVEKLSLSRGGASLTLERDEEKGWIASGRADVAIDGDAVAGVLRALRETRAEEAIPGAGGASPLGAPALTVTLSLEAGRGELGLDVFEADAKAEKPGQRARRRGEDGVLRFGADLLAALPSSLLAFRDRTLRHGDAQDVVALEITGPAAQRLERKDGVWKLVSPISVDADAAAARSAAELVAQARVERFDAERAAPVHGLAAPWAKVTARFEKGSPEDGAAGKAAGGGPATLEIGAPAGEDGSRFARFAGGDGLVFVLKKESVALAAQPLVARDALSIDPSGLAKIGVTAGGGSFTAVRSGDEWKVDGAPVDAGQLKRAIGELGAIRAIRGEAFGAPAGFDAPALKVEAWTQEQLDGGAPPDVLSFGAKTADAGEDGYTARKSGVDVTMVVPARLVNELIALVPAPAAAGAAE